MVGTDWVSAGAQIGAAASTFGLVVVALFALGQVHEARRARYGQLVADVARRWDSEALKEARSSVDRWGGVDGVRDAIRRAQEDLGNRMTYYRVLREPDFYEDMALLVKEKALDYPTLRKWIGQSTVDRYDNHWWKAVEHLGSTGGPTYPGWKSLAQRLRKDAKTPRPRGSMSIAIRRSTESTATPASASHRYVDEFTLRSKPGHYSEVASLYSSFAANFLANHDALEGVLVIGDEGSGIVRGIGVFADRPSADRVNSDPEFAAFNDAVAPMLATPPERVELALLHLFAKA